MPLVQTCAVEGCLEPAQGHYRWLDRKDKAGCNAHLGAGLVLQVPLCDSHGKLIERLGGETARWEGTRV